MLDFLPVDEEKFETIAYRKIYKGDGAAKKGNKSETTAATSNDSDQKRRRPDVFIKITSQ